VQIGDALLAVSALVMLGAGVFGVVTGRSLPLRDAADYDERWVGATLATGSAVLFAAAFGVSILVILAVAVPGLTVGILTERTRRTPRRRGWPWRHADGPRAPEGGP
jgi:hypothetical protein